MEWDFFYFICADFSEITISGQLGWRCTFGNGRIPIDVLDVREIIEKIYCRLGIGWQEKIGQYDIF